MPEGEGVRSINSRSYTTNEGDEEDDRGDELGTERTVNTWGAYVSTFNLFNFVYVIFKHYFYVICRFDVCD